METQNEDKITTEYPRYYYLRKGGNKTMAFYIERPNGLEAGKRKGHVY